MFQLISDSKIFLYLFCLLDMFLILYLLFNPGNHIFLNIILLIFLIFSISHFLIDRDLILQWIELICLDFFNYLFLFFNINLMSEFFIDLLLVIQFSLLILPENHIVFFFHQSVIFICLLLFLFSLD